MHIILPENELNISEIDSLPRIVFKDIERIYFLFYYEATFTKFIENKKFYVNFPQLKAPFDTLKKDITEKLKNDDIEAIIIIDIFNQLNYSTILNHNKVFYFNKNLFDEISLKITKEDLENEYNVLNQIEQNIDETDTSLILFNYDYVAVGGSFDHYHNGHNVNI